MALNVRDYLFVYHKRGEHDVIYEISDQDVSGTTKYYGYLNSSGGWIIQAFDTLTGQYRYKSGTTDYATNWTARAGISYVLFSALFAE